jgi:hypothetical protein
MTRQANARVAGFMFLFYIATAFPAIVLFNQATSGVGTAAKLASIAQHGLVVRVTVLLSVVAIFDALVLAVALFAITRDQDPDLAVLALCCRVAEGVIGAIPTLATVGLLSVATSAAGDAAPATAATNALGALLLKVHSSATLVSATCFAVGSTLYAYLFLRARSVPVWLAWLGVLGSALLVVAFPLQLAGFLHGPVVDFMWLPIGVFEVVLGFWLLIKGVAAPEAR